MNFQSSAAGLKFCGLSKYQIFASNFFVAHPLITNDTGTWGKGKFQLEANGGHSVKGGLTRSVDAYTFLSDITGRF